ncbi:regulatory protein RecX [Meiothermus sp.]|uniref:regulatory protein RecX n=1 Tax=Meiothermus sp. TaxID=1955249 RepID=UPI00307DDA6E
MKDETPDELFMYAVRVLGARAYSESVLRQKLARRAKPEVVGAVLQRVKSLGYLDDQQYAEGYTRLYAGKWGAAKLRRVLLEKGVARSIVDRVLAEQESQSDPVQEAVGLLDRYKNRHKGEKPRAIRFLVNRGYNLGNALAAWERFIKQATAP